VVAGAAVIEVVESGKPRVAAEVARVDAANDLALLQVRSEMLSLPATFDQQPPNVTESLTIVGNALAMPDSVYVVHSAHASLITADRLNDENGHQIFEKKTRSRRRLC